MRSLTFAQLLSVILLTLPARAADPLPKIHLTPDHRHFTAGDSTFTPWGFNYVGPFGQIAEEVWATDWPKIEKDFADMRALGANVVRVHLQFATYMKGPAEADPVELARLKKLLDLAQANHLYLDLTGLGCYHIKNVPAWYDAMDEAARWDAQAAFWEAITATCAGHPAVFCYDLMNEPVPSGPAKPGENKWLTGELGGMYFVQRLADQPGTRSGTDIAGAWVHRMTTAIRKRDPDTLITVGVIPWAQVWPGAKPIFYDPAVAKDLDFVSIHLYPAKGAVDRAVQTIPVYDIGRPIVIEETFPLSCSLDEFKQFMTEAKRPDGWISHYFGHTIAEHRAGAEPGGAAVADFLEYWKAEGERRGIR